jgi:sulfatase modifying factor 1
MRSVHRQESMSRYSARVVVEARNGTITVQPLPDSVRLLCVLVCVVELAACGYPRPADVVGDGAAPDDGAPRPTPPSCVALPSTCGTNGSDSCCNSSVVLGGTYYRSFDEAGDTISGNKSFPATIGNFRFDNYEVTVGRFRAFVEEGMGTQVNHPTTGAGTHANIAGSGWEASWNASLLSDKAALITAVKCDSTLQTWTDTAGPNENRPMNCISWYEAMAFCVWDGGYLPTEAEWNYAATGGDQQRAYPWSSPVAGSLTLDNSHASYVCEGDGLPSCGVTDLIAVGTRPLGDGRWRHSDLAGNVFEWTLDWYAAYSSSCTDCANLIPGSVRSIRGGNFHDDTTYLRTSVRTGSDPSFHFYTNGVRCARSAP